MDLGEEVSLQKKGGHQRPISYSNCGFCCLRKEEQHAICAHELQSALLAVEFFNIYCEL